MTDLPFIDRPFTLGNTQFYPANFGPDLIYRSGYTGSVIRAGDHEAAHSFQAERDGAFKFSRDWLKAGRGVKTNPLEIEADELALRTRSAGR